MAGSFAGVLAKLALGEVEPLTFTWLQIGIFMLREWPSALQVFGAAIALFGLTVFFESIPAPSELPGVLYTGIGLLALASTNNVARKLAIVTNNSLSNNVVSTIALWIGGIPVVVYGLVVEGPTAVSGWRNWGIIVFGAVVSIAIGITVWNHILRTLRSYEASMLGGSSVIFTALFAIPVLGEHLAGHEIAGIVLMLVGLVLAQFRRRWWRRHPEPESESP